MNKNGFIATSLIYSFFLIFITLFLTIIADYLQDKVLLNTIEKGIKDELNSTMGINDFEVGDMISFVDDCNNLSAIDNQWVVVNINYIDKKVVFYSYDFDGKTHNFVGTEDLSDLSEENINQDIELGYRNPTYINKILYTFKTGFNDYSLGNGKFVSINCSDIVEGEFNYGNNCITNSGTNPNCRKRLEKQIGDTKYNKCIRDNVGGGVIIIDV